MSGIKEAILLAIGNPLLDIIASVDGKFLEKYCLLPNNAILAREGDAELSKEIEEKYHPEYFVGGAAQNSIRIAQWILGGSSCALMGCVGKDVHSDILKAKVVNDGIDCRYQYTTEESTGVCNVLLSNEGTCRSLVTHLGASRRLSSQHLTTQKNQELLDKTSIIYITGFVYSVSVESIFKLAEISAKHNKIFCLNLSAPFLCKEFCDEMETTLPYVDVLFGNDEEASEYARCHNFGESEIKKIALKLAHLPKENAIKKRIVVITQGSEDIIVATDSVVTSYAVTRLSKDKIVDTNGAGDAFVGGFLSQLFLKRPLVESVNCGIWAATQIIQQFGCNPPKHLHYNT